MNLTKSKIFLTFCLSLILGVYLGKFLSLEVMAITAMIFVIAAALGYRHKPTLVISSAVLIMLLGALRFKLDYAQNDLNNFYKQTIYGTGTISEEPDVRPDKVLLTISGIQINDTNIQSKVLLTVPRFPEYSYGQNLSFQGKLQEPQDGTADDNFSYKDYLSRFGIDGIMDYPKVSVIGTGGNWLKSGILKFKARWTANLAKLMPEPQSAFLGGLLLGAKRQIPQSLIDVFNETGTSHMIAVSGYNITIIAAGVDWILRRFFRKRISFWLSFVAIWIFVIMTGASASVVRAGLMGSLALLAVNFGRLYAINNALAFTAALMLVINPQILDFDVGFQLSFAALLGLVYFSPLIEPYFQWLPKIFREYFLATIAAQIFTLPILLTNFGLLSLVAPLANVLVLPLVPITMLFGFLSGIAAFIWSGLAWPFVWITWVLLSYILKVLELLAAIPGSAVTVNFNLVWFVVYYVIIGLLLVMYHQKENIKSLLWKNQPSES